MTTPLLQAATLEDTNLSNLPRASMALLFHTSNAGLALVTAHEVIHDTHGNPHIGPGRAALPSDEKRLSELLAQRRRPGRINILPANVLHVEDGAIAWWIPPETREMMIRDAKGRDHTVLVQWPSLVGLVVNRRFYLAAAAGVERPTTTTELFHAPLGNIHDDTAVCTGSARLPSGQSVPEIDQWTDVITRTWFTHDNHALVLPESKQKKGKATDTSFRYQAAEFWINRSPDAGPLTASDMVPLGINLTSWVESIIDAGADE